MNLLGNLSWSALPCPPTGILEGAGTDVTTRFLAPSFSANSAVGAARNRRDLEAHVTRILHRQVTKPADAEYRDAAAPPFDPRRGKLVFDQERLCE